MSLTESLFQVLPVFFLFLSLRNLLRLRTCLVHRLLIPNPTRTVSPRSTTSVRIAAHLGSGRFPVVWSTTPSSTMAAAATTTARPKMPRFSAQTTNPTLFSYRRTPSGLGGETRHVRRAGDYGDGHDQGDGHVHLAQGRRTGEEEV